MTTEAEIHDRMALVRWCSMVDQRGTDDCWPWTGAVRNGGYGQFGHRGKLVGAGARICKACERIRGSARPRRTRKHIGPETHRYATV